MPDKLEIAMPEANQPSVAMMVDYDGSTKGVTIDHANQVMIQVYEREFILSFFMLVPPITLGTADQQAETVTSVVATPECVARISLPPHVLKSLVEIMQSRMASFDAAIAEVKP